MPLKTGVLPLLIRSSSLGDSLRIEDSTGRERPISRTLPDGRFHSSGNGLAKKGNVLPSVGASSSLFRELIPDDERRVRKNGRVRQKERTPGLTELEEIRLERIHNLTDASVDGS